MGFFRAFGHHHVDQLNRMENLDLVRLMFGKDDAIKSIPEGLG